MRPTPHSFEDHRWMQHALTLAMRMRGHVWPNPPVGCVIVKNGLIIAEGATRPGGRPHAERVALDRAGADARGATLYVTLEPCCHWGKTPPCADAIVEAGIAPVVCAIQDPDPRVNGGGFRVLRAAGVDLTIGPCRQRRREGHVRFLLAPASGRARGDRAQRGLGDSPVRDRRPHRHFSRKRPRLHASGRIDRGHPDLTDTVPSSSRHTGRAWPHIRRGAPR